MSTAETTPGDAVTLTLPQPNLPLLRKVIEWAEAEATKPADQCLWRQDTWTHETDCGTSFCIAGYAVMTSIPTAQVIGERGWNGFYGDGDGGRKLWDTTARELLGLTLAEADGLFDADNDLEDIRRIAELVAERSGDRL